MSKCKLCTQRYDKIVGKTKNVAKKKNKFKNYVFGCQTFFIRRLSYTTQSCIRIEK